MAEIQKVKLSELSLAILACKEVKCASAVAAFYPMKNEPNILFALETLAKENRLLLPRCVNREEMIFSKVQNLSSDLSQGNFGIFEPRKELPTTENISVFLVPGVKFSKGGERYGHGMGYYDRFLSRFPNACKIGICLENQWSEEPLVLQPHDILMDKIIIAN